MRKGAALGLAALCAGVAGDAWPQDGGASLTEENFREYIACFNQRDYACFGKYYAPGVTLSKGGRWAPLEGKKAIFDFYRDVDAHGLKEQMTIHSVVFEGDRISADLEASFTATQDWPDFGARVVKSGDRWGLRGVLVYQVRDGKFTAIAPAPRPASQEVGSRAACNRVCLQAFVDEYLAALVARDPARLRIADGARFTENGTHLTLGEGLWKTATADTPYKVYLADPERGQAGFIGSILAENGQPRMLALRLKVAAGRISEVETISGMPFTQPSSPLVSVPSPAFALPVPVAQRLSRSEMIAVADHNFDGILAAEGSHFAADCQRVENRMAMSGNPALDYPIAILPGRTKPAFAAMGCQAQVEAHLFDTLDSVDPRRYLVIDEERQLVFGVFMLNWYRDNRCNDVAGYGRVCRPDDQKPTGLRTAEILRVAGGKVHQVEVVFSFSSYQAPSGWELP